MLFLLIHLFPQSLTHSAIISQTMEFDFSKVYFNSSALLIKIFLRSFIHSFIHSFIVYSCYSLLDMLVFATYHVDGCQQKDQLEDEMLSRIFYLRMDYDCAKDIYHLNAR